VALDQWREHVRHPNSNGVGPTGESDEFFFAGSDGGWYGFDLHDGGQHHGEWRMAVSQ
jgi:hypothetical protein